MKILNVLENHFLRRGMEIGGIYHVVYLTLSLLPAMHAYVWVYTG